MARPLSLSRAQDEAGGEACVGGLCRPARMARTARGKASRDARPEGRSGGGRLREGAGKI